MGKWIGWGSGVTLVACVVVGIYLLVETVAHCPSAEAIAKLSQLQTIHPQRIVIRPWRGQHNIYAVFTVPGGNRARFSFVKIPGERRYCTTGAVSTRSTDGVLLPPNSYLLKTYLNTRVALWLWVRGLGQELRQPGYWVAAYSPEVSGE